AGAGRAERKFHCLSRLILNSKTKISKWLALPMKVKNHSKKQWKNMICYGRKCWIIKEHTAPNFWYAATLRITSSARMAKFWKWEAHCGVKNLFLPSKNIWSNSNILPY